MIKTNKLIAKSVSAKKSSAPTEGRITKKTVPSKRQVLTQRVLPLGNGWVIKPDHLKKFITVTTTQKQAIEIATELAKNDHCMLIIHNKNGTIKSKKSFARLS